MNSFNFLVVLVFCLSFTVNNTLSFSIKSSLQRVPSTTAKMTSKPCDMSGHPSTLPGDPSLNLVTNVDLGDKKLEIMKGQ